MKNECEWWVWKSETEMELGIEIGNWHGICRPPYILDLVLTTSSVVNSTPSLFLAPLIT